MEIFLFEYVTSGGEAPEEIVVEGLGMFKSFYDGFCKIPGVEVNSFIKSGYIGSLSSRFEKVETISNQSIERIEEYVEEYAEKSDCSLLIAPEDDNTLLKLTGIVEKKSENLGSRTKGIAIAADKWKTYKKLKEKVNVPKTSKKPLELPFVLKPRVSCGGGGIEVVESEEKLSRFEDHFPKGYIAQELIKGHNLSVSLLIGEEVIPLSINGQLIENFRYKGAEVPARVEKREVEYIFEEVVNAVYSIRGLHGYVGVDVILSDVPYIIEINARPTTPVILFDKIYGFNLSRLILENHFRGFSSSFKDMWRDIKKIKPERFVLEKVKLKGKSVYNNHTHIPTGAEMVVKCAGYALIFHPASI